METTVIITLITAVVAAALAFILGLRTGKKNGDERCYTLAKLSEEQKGRITALEYEAKRLNERMILIVNNIKDFLNLGGKPVQSAPSCKPSSGIDILHIPLFVLGIVLIRHLFTHNEFLPTSHGCMRLV